MNLLDLSPREIVGLAIVFESLEFDPAKAAKARGFVVLESGLVACCRVKPRRIVDVLPANRIAW